MDWIIIGLLAFLLLTVVLIIVTLYNLLPLGDERRKIIQQEAAAYTFAVVIVYFLIEIAVMFYTNLATTEKFEGLNPLIVLTVISLGYLISLWRTKKKYGG